MTVKAFVFDLDGVIVLSELLGLRAWRKWLAPYGKTLSDAQYDNLIGLDAQVAAGMYAVAVPNERLRNQDFSGAEARFASLRELTVNLDILLAC